MSVGESLTRLPFTLTMLLALIAVGLYGRSHIGLLDEQLHERAGYSMRSLVQGELHRAVTSLLFTASGWRFYSSLVMFALAVGCVEWNHGTRVSSLTFFGVHFATLAVMLASVFVWLAASDSHRAGLLWDVQDVGPSAGYYGCLGLAMMSLPTTTRTALIVAIVTVLVGRAAWSWIHLPENGRMLSADLAHVIAFPLGLLVSRVWILG